jgi:hypothetical protein
VVELPPRDRRGPNPQDAVACEEREHVLTTLRGAAEYAEEAGALAAYVVLILPPEHGGGPPGAGAGGTYVAASSGMNARHHYALLGALSAAQYDMLWAEEG